MSSTRNRATKHAALPLAAFAVAALSAFAAPSASAQALQVQRIVIDPDTGRPRMPEHDELAAARAKAQAARASARSAAPEANAVKSALQAHPAAELMTARPLNAQLGAKGSRVDASRLSFTVVRRSADGSVSTQCITGEDNATKALQSALVGDAHDH